MEFRYLYIKTILMNSLHVCIDNSVLYGSLVWLLMIYKVYILNKSSRKSYCCLEIGAQDYQRQTLGRALYNIMSTKTHTHHKLTITPPKLINRRNIFSLK